MSEVNLPLLVWRTESLWAELEPLLPGLSVEVVQRSASTNTALLERSRIATEANGTADGANAQVRRSVESAAFGRRAADIDPCLLVAEHQTGGRGRQGRSWHSAPGASLTFSLSLPLRAGDLSGLSLAVGVALCEALAMPSAATRLGLKWPNDLWLMDKPGVGRKLGGVLIETVSSGPRRLVVVGVGVNVLPVPAADLASGFACVQELDPAATAPSTLMRVALPLVQALRLFEQQGFAPFAERYAELDVLRNLPVVTTQRDVSEGMARGVSARGELQVETVNGLKSVASGEVSVRPAAPR